MPEPFAGCFYFPPTENEPGECSVYWGPDCINRLVKRCKQYKGIIYAHNGGKFDFHFLLNHLPLDASHALCIGSRIVSLKFPAGYEFRDSYSLIPLPLSAWGKTEIDINKLKADRREKNKTEIIEYLKDDCKYLHQMLSVFFGKWGQKLTLAGTTFGVLKQKFGYEIPNMSAKDDSRFRPHYFAGRVQHYTIGRHVGNFTMLDINSAFPAAMTRAHWFGSKYQKIQGKPKPEDHDQSFIICECVGGGALPLRADDGSVTFPVVGRHKFHCTGWEISAGLRCGVISELEYIYSFTPRRISDFSPFVDFFYKTKSEAKRAGDMATEFHAKLFLNSCYGRFALDIDKYRDVKFMPFYTPPIGEHWEESWHDTERGLSVYERKSKLGPRGRYSKFYCICTAASITGWVRAFLFESMKKCREVLYCDTDSILASGVSKLKTGDELGEWKIEMECDIVWIGGKKIYVLHNKKFPFLPEIPKGERKKNWIFIEGHGWNPLPTKKIKSFKMASKGVRLPLKKLISVCEGKTETGKFDAPSYSALAPSRFCSRKIKRADKRG
jgi:DNA polymerase elongation subunit (family B)